jgi:hypothetical protein
VIAPSAMPDVSTDPVEIVESGNISLIVLVFQCSGQSKPLLEYSNALSSAHL